jgi:hypothetical protein
MLCAYDESFDIDFLHLKIVFGGTVCHASVDIIYNEKMALSLYVSSVTHHCQYTERFLRSVSSLAQSVERWPFKPVVVGSSPTGGDI